MRADAAQLRSLIDREGRSVEATNRILLDRAHSIFDDMTIGFGYQDNPTWFAGPWQRSDTYFKLALIPTERKWTPLDFRDENRFDSLIHEHYRRVRSTLGTVALGAANRSADYYEYRWYHKNLAYEGRWRITDHLDIAHATKINDEDCWSLVDSVLYTILLLRLGAKWWRTFNYFGDGILSAELTVRDLRIRRGKSNQFLPIFNPGEGDSGMRSDVLVEHALRAGSQAYVPINFATMRDSIPRIVTGIMNPLLRSLGHAVLWSEFEDDVRVIVDGSRS